jgi:hypothetical protein
LQALEQIDPNTSRAIQKQLRDAAKADTRQQGQAVGATPTEGQPMQQAAPMPA